MEITKEMFTAAMTGLENQLKHDEKCHEAFNVILPNDFTTGYDTNYIVVAMIELLQDLTNDELKWIDYFVWELKMGEEYEEGNVVLDGENVPLKTIEDLWNILQP